ncbi:serine/threonine-protein kinase [Dolichospermum sp. ST_sed1]|nr:serine/threonine-protein kinase [Dolichospermum sp. ST_sed1]MDD1425866.1 serine/threonine-protein kinase [Dolichospermum sp. ST_sed9]MDD1434660.1 serine/threonine-protein kinase [Dolichospermum sp. ST_sed6]MDD1438427.1 serine/threonine-protein kinase [Dolichospermum sp. ST_sed10]MDD1444135.1 serine/threonine-protein kinase [Dolichospermum sp. ST_sed3]MDD1449524.1 serine/threonine-protein kinase [Dolichospermum sp. ST_sed8]MDD1458335.1 serine/threonine-protein kinase [Dolichospermum sp. ST_
MSYCVNPTCSHPKNPASSQICEACGSQLLLRERFRVVKPIGQGGFGATFLAVEENLPGNPPCVIKQLRPSSTTPYILKMARELFAREAETLGKIGNHPQIPRLLDYFEDSNQFYLVQEYVSGLTLQQEVKQNGVYSETGIRQFLSEIMPLLQYIHEQQVIHRDIKPANLIRRSQDARLVLIDFGAVKNKVSQVTNNESEQSALTAYAIGTPGFAPPEQMAMRPVYASDIYAVGVTCIYLLTAKIPKDLEYNPTTGEMMWEHLVEVSDHLTTVLKKMLDVSVRNRYKIAQEVLTALEIEPYLDSLSQGLLSQPTGSALAQSNPNFGVDSISYTRGKNDSVAKLAASIRSRKDKTPEGTERKYGQTQGREFVPKSAARDVNNIDDPLSVRKLDSQGLLAAYQKGRRDFAAYHFMRLSVPGANLSGINFHAAQFDKPNFQATNLQNTDFGRTSLKEANFKEADLTKAYFSNADLEGADLRGANLSQAYLSQANLRGANLSGANLTGAKVTDEQLAVAKTNWLTVRTNGKRGLF